jgi:hypothetical protein
MMGGWPIIVGNDSWNEHAFDWVNAVKITRSVIFGDYLFDAFVYTDELDPSKNVLYVRFI